MPQTQWLFDRLNGPTGDFKPMDPHGKTAAQAVAAWLDALEALQPPTCEVTFVTQGPDFTVPGQEVIITGQVGGIDTGELGRWNPTLGVKLAGDNFPQWQGTTALPQGEKLQFKVVIVDSRPQIQQNCGGKAEIRWATGFNREATVNRQANCTQTIQVEANDFQDATCE